MAGEFFRQMRTAAIDWLSRPFGGDQLCGELLLLQLLCKNSGFCGGSVSRRMTLNIYNQGWGSDKSAEAAGSASKSWCSMAEIAGPPCAGYPAGSMSYIADSVAAATAAIYPFVSVLPVTDTVSSTVSAPSILQKLLNCRL